MGVLTYNVYATGREADLRSCLGSIDRDALDDFVLLTNGSTDGTGELVEDLAGMGGFTGISEWNCPTEIWYGNTRIIEELEDCDLIVLSADDLVYDLGWLDHLRAFIEGAPPELALASAYMEPVWEWNAPVQTVRWGGEVGLERRSLCGSSWAFRSKDWKDWMGPFDEVMPGEDLKICERINARGARMAALDLADHVGQERSAWGNKSHLTAKPLDPDWEKRYDLVDQRS